MPVYTPAFDLILNLADKTATGLLALDGSRVLALPGTQRASKAIRGAEALCRIRACNPTGRSDRPFDDVDLTGATVRVSVGTPDELPSSGAAPIAVTDPEDPLTSGLLVVGSRYLIAALETGDDFSNVSAEDTVTGSTFIATGTTPAVWTNGSALLEITADIALGATYAEVATALNATAAITSAGGVTVLALGTAAWKVTFVGFGEQLLLTGPLNAGLSPLSVVSVVRSQTGTAGLHEVQIIRFLALPAAFATLATPLPAAAATIEEIQATAAALLSSKRLVLDPAPYAGTFVITIGTRTKRVPYNVTAEELQALAGPEIEVVQRAANIWEFTHQIPGSDLTLSISEPLNLSTPLGVTGAISLNTPGIFEAFAATTRAWIKLTLEVKIAFPGQAPQVYYQGEIELWRDLLNEGVFMQPVLAGLNFALAGLTGDSVVTNQITALRGGSFALEAVDTTALAPDALWFFPINGVYQSWMVKTGPADVDDPTGQVAPLNYHATLNDKHWERSGL